MICQYVSRKSLFLFRESPTILLIYLHSLPQIFGFPMGATLGLPRMSKGIHHGY